MASHRRAHTVPAVSVFAGTSGCTWSKDTRIGCILEGLGRSVGLGARERERKREARRNNNLQVTLCETYSVDGPDRPIRGPGLLTPVTTLPVTTVFPSAGLHSFEAKPQHAIHRPAPFI